MNFKTYGKVKNDPSQMHNIKKFNNGIAYGQGQQNLRTDLWD